MYPPQHKDKILTSQIPLQEPSLVTPTSFLPKGKHYPEFDVSFSYIYLYFIHIYVS